MKEIGYEYSWGIRLEKGSHMQTEESVNQGVDDMSEEMEWGMLFRLWMNE